MPGPRLLKLLASVTLLAASSRAWVFNSVHAGGGETSDRERTDRPALYHTDTNELDENDPPEPPRERIVLTFPGTKWCGPGNVALSYHDLGPCNETDRCCRAHDLCGDLIPAGQTAHGLVNDDFYTKLNCKCDDKFHKCLHRARDGAGDTIGKLYFDAIGTQCFRLDYPVAQCTAYRGLLRSKCVEYEYDTSREKVYQWFDVPPY